MSNSHIGTYPVTRNNDEYNEITKCHLSSLEKNENVV